MIGAQDVRFPLDHQISLSLTCTIRVRGKDLYLVEEGFNLYDIYYVKDVLISKINNSISKVYLVFKTLRDQMAANAN